MSARSLRRSRFHPTDQAVARRVATRPGSRLWNAALLLLLAASPAWTSPRDEITPGPLVELTLARATGTVVSLEPGGVVAGIRTVLLRDSLDLTNLGRAPADTTPARALLEFCWRSEPTIPGAPAVAYEYKLDEPSFVRVDASVTCLTYNTGIAGDTLTPGTKVFTLRAIDASGATRELTRRFVMNYSPDTWFAGPDTAAFDARFPHAGRDRAVAVSDWNALEPVPGSLVGCDSLRSWPAQRARSRTFFEIYRDTLYVRAEGDTVHRNSWVVFHSGGADADSPYGVHVESGFPIRGLTECETPDDTARAVRAAGLVGSPIGFRFQTSTNLDQGSLPGSPVSSPSPSPLYPYFDASSSLQNERIAGYMEARQSGRVYLVVRAEDGDGALDRRVVSGSHARRVVDEWDAGIHTPQNAALRPLIMSFWVNRGPWLDFSPPNAWPRPPAWNGGAVASVPYRSLPLNLHGRDPDPLEPATAPPRTGGPSSATVLRYDLTVLGRNAAGRDTTYRLPSPVIAGGSTSFIVNLAIDAPHIVGTDVTLRIELCDCAQCEQVPGSGRCVHYDVPVRLDALTATLASLVAVEAQPERVRLSWQLGEDAAAEVERRTPAAAWQVVGAATDDGGRRVSFEDRAVEAGARYGYRLALTSAGERRVAGEVWTEVPRVAAFELHGVQPNPATAGATIAFSLADASPATLDVFDPAGRRVWTARLAAGPGRHVVPVGADLAPGVYVVKLAQSGRVRTARAVVVR